MPRIIQLVVPAERTERILDAVRQHEGFIGLQLQQGASLHPPGDIITLQVTNRALHGFIRMLSAEDVGRGAGSSLTTSEVASIVSTSWNDRIVTDSSEATWEEMEVILGKESNMTLNTMALMAIAGIVMSIALMTGALHLAIGAMVIAPGFEPIARIALGWTTKSWTWSRGLIDTAKAYLALLLGAAAGTGAMQLQGPPSDTAYLPPAALLQYWSSLSAGSVLVTAAAGFAGALLIATYRAVLTAGVMIALALIPAPVIVVIGLMQGDLALAGNAALRWLVEALFVLVMSFVVMQWKRVRIQRRPALW